MRGPFFQRSLRELNESLDRGEIMADVEALYTIIVQARRALKNRGEDDEKVTLFTLCFFSWPGKAPAFREQVRSFRKSFAGSAMNRELREDFRTRLLPRLLEAANVEELVPLNHISEVFIVKEEDLGRGAEKLGLPPVTSPELKYYSVPSAKPQQQQEQMHAP
jgi:hypothetical protein